MTLKIGIAGVTGWTGRAVAEAVLAADDLELVAGVSRSAAGEDLGRLLTGEPNAVQVRGRVEEALDGGPDAMDVLIDYTAHDVVRDHALTAIGRGVSVVVGTSGLTAADLDDLDAAAREHGVGVIAAGNFSLTAALAQAAALLAARHLPHWEVVDYASEAKPDAPSGTARELAERLAQVRTPQVTLPVAETAGLIEARGAGVAGGQVHSVRLPGFTLSTEVIFGLPDERLSIRHDSGTSAAPYVAGTLIAARAAPTRVGLTRGLDQLILD